MKTEMWKIEQLKQWDKNPRTFSKKDLARVKKQVEKWGQYKPLIVTPEGVVLGGNARLEAYREMALQDIWVSIVEPMDEGEKLEYAMSDNDVVGSYIEPDLKGIFEKNKDLDPELFRFSAGKNETLDQLLAKPPKEKKEAGEAQGEVGENISDEPYVFKIILKYQDADFKMTMARLSAYSEKFGLLNNTEAVVHLLERWKKDHGN